jgi:hypothetical protein
MIKILSTYSDSVNLVLSREDLRIIRNALNEITNGVQIEDWEFQTRMGVTRVEARAVLVGLGEAVATTDTHPTTNADL